MGHSFEELTQSLSEIDTALKKAEADNDPELVKKLRVAQGDLLYVRAKSLLAERQELVDALSDARKSVEAVIGRIERKSSIAGLFSSTDEAADEANSSGSQSTVPLEKLPTKPPVAAMDAPELPPPGGPDHFVSARKTATKTNLFIDEKGREFLRIGGSRSWRNFNPGNIRKGSFSENAGAIGDDGSFAIFPDKETGSKAIELLLRGRIYGPLSITGAINRYAPSIENDTNSYVDFVVSQTGLNPENILDNLNIAQIRSIVKAVERMEGWLPGEMRAHAPSSGQPNSSPGSGISAAIGASQDWMDVARFEASLPTEQRSEATGSANNPRIIEYFRVGAGWFNPPDGDETDWCAAFVNYCLETSGHVGTNHPGARSFFWNKKSQFIVLKEPRLSCIAVRRYAPFDDPTWKSGKGHVGFVVNYSSETVRILGGNQSNTVQEKTYRRKTLDSNGMVLSDFVAFLMPVMT